MWLPTLPCSVHTPAHPWTFLRPSQEKKPLILLLIRLRRKFFLVVFSLLLCRSCKGAIPCYSPPRDESDTIERTRDGTKSLSQKFVFRLPCFPPRIINNISSAKRVPAAWGRRALFPVRFISYFFSLFLLPFPSSPGVNFWARLALSLAPWGSPSFSACVCWYVQQGKQANRWVESCM